MNKTTVVAIGIFVALLVSVVLIYSFEKAVTAHAISRLRERTDADTYAKGSKTTTREKSASAESRAWEGQGSSGSAPSSPADDGYSASSTSTPMPTSTQRR